MPGGLEPRSVHRDLHQRRRLPATNTYTCVFGTIEELPEPAIDLVKTAIDGIDDTGEEDLLAATFTADHTIEADDFDNDDLLTNIATVTATGIESSLPVSANDDETVTHIEVLAETEEAPQPPTPAAHPTSR